MAEQDKQESVQPTKEKTQPDKKALKGSTPKSSEPQAGMATDPEAMKDSGYVERIEEKTKKH